MFLNYKVFGFILLMLLIFSTASAQNQIIGNWLSEDKAGITSIYENSGKYFGKITWLKKPNDSKDIPFTDTENPDKSKRKQPLIGLIILKDFYYKSNKWEGGTIYDPESGTTYTCTMWLENTNTLKVRGY